MKPRSKLRRALAQAYTAWAFLCLVGPIALVIIASQLRERSLFTRSKKYRRLYHGY